MGIIGKTHGVNNAANPIISEIRRNPPISESSSFKRLNTESFEKSKLLTVNCSLILPLSNTN